MKFHQVALGQRFELEGEWYVKDRPLTATHEASGRSRLLRRSANVSLSAGVAPPASQQTLSVQKVQAAFEVYHAQCLACVQDLLADAGPTQTSAVHDRLDVARREFLGACS
ncbi:MAG: hypothetical protein RQ736_10180 [Thiogranum sp.]|nr:hypothetical protein [Thiogranum sp.]